MKTLFAPLTAALLLALLPGVAQAYSSTQSASTTTQNGWDKTFTFSNLPPATGNISISVSQNGDFGHSSEFSTVYIDGTNQGDINPSQSNIDCNTESGSYTVSASAVSDGTLTVRIDASSNVGTFCSGGIQYSVTVSYSEGNPPTANAGGPYTVNQGVALTPTGAASVANTGSIVLYEWDCTDNGSYDVSSTSPTGSSCTYPDDGAQTLRLRVTNTPGLTATSTASVTVTNTPPVANAGGPYSVNQGVALAVNGGGSSDPDGSIALYEWDCTSDGSYDSSSASPTSAPCTYADVGGYTLTLRVTDDDGGQATATAGVTVTNTAPVAEAGGPYAGSKGFPVAVSGAASSDPDGSIALYEWDCDNDSVYELSSASPAATCTFAAVGSYPISLRVTDDDGATSVDGATIAVGNDAPTSVAGGPYTGAEGAQVALDGGASSDPGTGAVVLYEWDCTNDGSYDASGSTATGNSCVYVDDGSYTLSLRVTDDDGATAVSTTGVTISNVAPSVVLSAVTSADEGANVNVGATGTDPGSVDQAALTYAWTVLDPGGATLFTGGNANETFVFPDDGVYTLSVVVTDPQGATGTDSASITIGNVDPSFVSVTGPATGDEGASQSFSAVVDDAGSADVAGLVTTWDWGDGSPVETGSSFVHVWADDGVYTVTVTVTDDDGGSSVQTPTITVGNVAPTITTSAPTNGLEGVQYSYQPAVSDPGDEVFTWSLSASAPAGMTVDPSTGLINWTPTYAQSLVGSFSLVLTVSDGDGGTDAQSFTITLLSADADGDGMADSWETDNGLDPNDPSDGAADPDGDGLSNLEEFGQGTDPNQYDGPTLPTLFAPIAGAEVATDRPDLVLDNATDPQNDTLVYDYEVYAEAALTTLVTTVSGILEDGSGQTLWKVDAPLAENTMYWWRARVSDPFVTSPWTLEESFFVNTVEDAPEAPILVYPIAGETAASLSPELVWSEAFDPDGDELTYDVEVWDDGGVLVASITGVTGDGVEGRWTVDVALEEDAYYTWTARAVDEHGVLGPFASEESFFVDTDNAAPFGTVFLEPLDNATLSSIPTLVASEGVDPEAGPLEYRFEVDSAPGFDSGSAQEVTLPGTGTGTVSWNLFAEGINLTENATTWARVRALDEGGVSSTPDTISFFLRGDNDPPSVPVLLAPADGSEGPASPEFSIEDPTDPEGDLIYLDVVIARDAELTDIIDEASGLLVTGAGSVEWSSDVGLIGTVYWSARAVDAGGAQSQWAAPYRYDAPSEAVGPGDDDDSSAGAGCDCDGGEGEGAAAALLCFALLSPAPWRRRRRA